MAKQDSSGKIVVFAWLTTLFTSIIIPVLTMDVWDAIERLGPSFHYAVLQAVSCVVTIVATMAIMDFVGYRNFFG